MASYNYQWLRNGVAISGATSSTYTVTTTDVGATLKSEVMACDSYDDCSTWAQSSNSIVPVSQPPNAPTNLTPTDCVQASPSSLSSVFSDPDSTETGYVSYSLYRESDNALMGAGSGPWVSSGSASAWTPPSLAAEHWYYWNAQAGDASQSSSPTAVQYLYVNAPPSVPTLGTPAATSPTLFTTTPVLTASGSTDGGQTTDGHEQVYYEFEVATDSGFANVVADSGPVAGSGSWSVTPGALQLGHSYYWRARAVDSCEGFSSWTGSRSFAVSLSGLGVRGDWPIWSHGPVSVNEANGNVVLSLPTPSYPAASGSLGLSLTYNSEATTGSAGLGAGWTLVAGDGSMSPPQKLTDHNVATPIYQGVVVDWPDGSSGSYSEVGSSNTYLPGSGDGSQLTKNPDGTWTLLDSDGTSYTFGAENSSSGVALLTSAEAAGSSSQHGILSYSFNSTGDVTSLGYQQTSTSASETLTFNWSCSGALFCVTGPDGRTTWTYTANASNQITGVNDGTRQLLALAYTNGLLSQVQNADDLDPTHASPNYNGNHALTISYDTSTPARAVSVSETHITNQTPSTTSTWSFSYHPGAIEPTPPRTSHYGYAVRNDAPAAYYPLDETSGTTANDASGNGNNTTYSGGYTLGQAGALAGSGSGTAVNFGGGTIAANQVSGLDLSPQGYNTVEFWMNWKGVGGEMPFGFGSNYDLFIYSGCFGFNTGRGDVYGISIPSDFANAWHYVVAEFYNGDPRDEAKLWIDGVQQTMSCTVGTPGPASVSSNFDISGWPTSNGYRLGGGDSMDEVALYGYALSPPQIAAHFAAAVHDPAPVAYYPLDETSGTSAVDATGNGNTGTYSGSYTLGASGAYTGSSTAASFNGGTVSASVPNLNTSAGAYNTVEFWMKWNGTTANAPMPFGFGGAGGYYDLEFDGGYFGFNTGCGDIYGITTPSGWNGTWQHVVAEFYNGLPQNGAKLWIDDVQQSLSIKTGTPCTASVSPTFNISGWPHDTNYGMGGSIDEVALYNNALTPAEIANHYNTNLTANSRNGAAAGYTALTPPNQQGQSSPKYTTSYYDSLGRTIETIDRLGRISESGYTASDQPLWSEDAAGNPTDFLYGGTNGKPSANTDLANVLLATIAPDPGSGSRPITTDRYDEQTLGSSTQPGNTLNGLAGSYWTGTTLSGQPVARENDPLPTSTASGFILPAGGMTWPPAAVGSGTFSARWTGDVMIPSAGHYTFTTKSNGSTRLMIDGSDSIENWSSPTSPFDSQPVPLSAGLHNLVLEYAHTTGTPSIELDWGCSDCSSPIASRTPIPLTDLLPAWANQTSVVSPTGRISFQHYLSPERGQPDYSLVRRSDGTNLITSYAYDPLGRTTTKDMPKANSGKSLDPATGDLSSTPAADPNYESNYVYYPDGAGATIPSACGGGSVANEYGQLDTSTDHGLHSVETVYNAAGLPIAITNAKGTSCLSYDGENRLTSQTPYGDQTAAATINYTYDPTGAILQTQQGTGSKVTNAYDEAGRLIDTVDAYGAEARYCYDADSNITSRATDTSGFASTGCPFTANYVTTYSYDAADRLTGETDPANKSYSFFYDSRGNLRGTQYPNGTFSWVDTNPDGWVSDQYNRHGTISSTTTTAPADSSPIADYSYTYNQDGKQLTESRTSGTTTQTTSYSYDNAGRLSQVVLPAGTCRSYGYDLDSNRQEIDNYSTSTCSGTPTSTTNYTYDPTTTPGTDELTKIVAGATTTNYGYTSDGQVSSQGTTSYAWDGWGRLATATVGSNTITYTYDPRGALETRSSSSPSSTINYLLGDLIETNGSRAITTSYTDGPGGNLASFNGPPRSSSTATYLYYDAHGNLAAEASSAGSQSGNHTYDPFGAPNDSVPANTTVHRFVGRWNKQYDTATGLILMGARPYDPNTGRFLAVDPVPGGSLNNYDYAGQDPINGYDLAGTWPSWLHPIRWFHSGTHAALNGVAFLVYAPYYGIHWAAGKTHNLIFFNPLGPQLLGAEAASLGGDVGLDWVKKKFGYESTVCDEGPFQHLNPFHGPGKGTHFLPGCRRVNGHVHIDFP